MCGARLSQRLRLERIPSRRKSLRHHAARWPARIGKTARADFHARHKSLHRTRRKYSLRTRCGNARQAPRRKGARREPGYLQSRSSLRSAPGRAPRGHQIRIWSARRRIDLDRRSAHAGFLALLASSTIQAWRRAAFFRQTICSRLSGTDPVVQNATRPRTAPRRSRGDSCQIPGGVSHPGWPRTGLASRALNKLNPQAECGIVKDQLEGLVSQMVERGILFEEAIGEFEKRFIKRTLERAQGNQCRAAKMLGIHRNTLSRKIGEYKLDRNGSYRRWVSRKVKRLSAKHWRAVFPIQNLSEIKVWASSPQAVSRAAFSWASCLSGCPLHLPWLYPSAAYTPG